MKKIYLLPLLFTLLLFTSCSVTQQSYSYQHHGTDTLKSNADFSYVERNVMGKAKSTIKMSAWKKTTQQLALNGLMSEAKGNLPVLTDNQAFANLSIDQLLTTNQSSGGNVSSVTIEIVVSADIIQYE